MMWMNGGYNGERQSRESELQRPRQMADAMAKEIAIALTVLLLVEPALIGRGLGVAALAGAVAWAWWASWQQAQRLLVRAGFRNHAKLRVSVFVLLVGWFVMVFAALNIEWLKFLNQYWWPVKWGIENERGLLWLGENVVYFDLWLMTLRAVVVIGLPIVALPYCPLLYRQFVEIIFPMYANTRFTNISPTSLWNPFFNVSESQPEKTAPPEKPGATVIHEWQEPRDGGGVTIRREEVSHLTDEQWRYLAHAIVDLGQPFTEEALAGQGKPLSGPEFRKLKELWIKSKRLELIGRNARQGYRVTAQGLSDLKKWSPTDKDEDNI